MALFSCIVQEPCLPQQLLLIHLWEAHSFPQHCVLESPHIQMICHVALMTTLVLVIPGGKIFSLADMISVTICPQVLSSCVTWKKV